MDFSSVGGIFWAFFFQFCVWRLGMIGVMERLGYGWFVWGETYCKVAHWRNVQMHMWTRMIDRQKSTRLVMIHNRCKSGRYNMRSTRITWKARKPTSASEGFLSRYRRARFTRTCGNERGILSTARFESAAESGRPRRLRSCALRVSTLQPAMMMSLWWSIWKGSRESLPSDLNRRLTLRDDQSVLEKRERVSGGCAYFEGAMLRSFESRVVSVA